MFRSPHDREVPWGMRWQRVPRGPQRPLYGGMPHANSCLAIAVSASERA